jgi:hypothetical protein
MNVPAIPEAKISFAAPENDADKRLVAYVYEYAKTALSFCAFAVIVATIYFEGHHLFAMPIYDDMFDRLRMYRAMVSGTSFFEYLIAPHNEHRIFTTRLLELLDEVAFGGKEYVQVVSAHVLQFASSLLTLYVFRRADRRGMTRGASVLLFSALVLLFVNPNFLYTLLVPFQVQHAIMEILCVLAAVVVSGASEQEHGPALRDVRFFAALLALAVIASFTLANGPVILLAAAASAVALRWRMTTTLVLVALALVHLVLVVATTHSVGEKSHDIMAVLKFVLVYLGAPFSRFDPWPGSYVTYATSTAFAMTAGAIILATGVLFGIARLLKPGFGGSLAVFGLVLLLIVVATGLAGGISRAQFGVLEGGSKKYASFAALGWVGSFAIYVALLRARFASRAFAVEATSLVVLLLLLPLSAIGFGRETRLWQKGVDRNWEAATAVLFKVNTSALQDIYQPPADIANYVKFVEPLNRGVFAEFPYRWGQDAAALLQKMHATTCRGSAQQLTPLGSADRVSVFDAPGTPAKISGWTWMDSDHAPARMVIAVDPTHHIVGLARTTRPGEIAEEWLSEKMGRDVGWFGYARIQETPLRFYAISRNGRHYCDLGGVGDVR